MPEALFMVFLSDPKGAKVLPGFPWARLVGGSLRGSATLPGPLAGPASPVACRGRFSARVRAFPFYPRVRVRLAPGFARSCLFLTLSLVSSIGVFGGFSASLPLVALESFKGKKPEKRKGEKGRNGGGKDFMTSFEFVQKRVLNRFCICAVPHRPVSIVLCAPNFLFFQRPTMSPLLSLPFSIFPTFQRRRPVVWVACCSFLRCVFCPGLLL